ncbi:MAG TPA: OsmC family protein [Acidobacteriota bacterium]|nr:OsmC family protein [Acidobacteriota bacterium]
MKTLEDRQSQIKTAFERNQKALTLRPTLGRGTAVTRVRMVDGLTCEVEEGPWKIVADMGEKSGGCNGGPNPGFLGRAALGSCLAVGYVLWAAKRDLPLISLEVEVQADYDSRSYHGIGEAKPGYQQVRYVVRIESPAAEEEIRAVLDEADAHSDYLAVFARPQEVRREVEIVESRQT